MLSLAEWLEERRGYSQIWAVCREIWCILLQVKGPRISANLPNSPILSEISAIRELFLSQFVENLWRQGMWHPYVHDVCIPLCNWSAWRLDSESFRDSNKTLKEHNLICLPNKIRLNLIHTFVMCRNKHISKKTPCFSRKRSKNKAKPNEFERRILKLSCYACSDNPKCRHAFSMFGNASSQNEFRFNLLRCMNETFSVALQ